MTPRCTVILSTLAGVVAGATLVAGLAFQPDRGQPERAQGDRPEDRQPEDRQRPNGPRREGQPPRDGQTGRRPVMDRERLVRRLEELTKRLDSERETVAKLLAELKTDKPLDALDPQIREAMMIAGGRQFRNENQGPGPSPDERQELHRLVREADPDLARRMEEFQKKRPIGGAILMYVAPKPADVIKAKAESPELFDLYRQQIASGLDVADLALEILDLRRANEPDAEPLRAKRAQLREAVGRSFDLRGKLQERDLESLVKRVDDLRSRVQAAAADREKNIDTFVARVTRMLDDLARRAGKPGEPPPGENPPPEGRRPRDNNRPGGPPPR